MLLLPALMAQFLEQIQYVAEGGTLDGLLERFQNRDISDSVVVYCRVITACYMKVGMLRAQLIWSSLTRVNLFRS